MIDREQIAAALGGLEPREREILDYSLHRRVPDMDLATILGGTADDVARQRTAAVDRLARQLNVQGGAELGHVLKQLLEGATWELVQPAAPVPDAAGDEQGHRPARAGDLPGAPPASAAPPEPPLAEAGRERDRKPVFDMLSARSPRTPGDHRPRIGKGPRRVGIAVLAAVAIVTPAGMVAALTLGDDPPGGGGQPISTTRPFKVQRQPAGEPFPSDPKRANRYPTAYVRRSTVLYDKPGGRRKVRISAKTEFDSPRVLSVVRTEGRWLAVLAPELKNGERGWIRAKQVTRLDTVSYSLHVDVSRRRLTVR
ncbi:MAG: hypothetical protein M3301_07085, partial [Chloroflexota bacterium]|nr:hypothetical protein [Chloroflexota bacterium]